MIASYHNHTYRCNHATGSEEEFILHAINNKIKILGFSDHAPHCFFDALCSSRMKLAELKDYVYALTKLREKYKDYIEIKIGLELEYFPFYHNTDLDIYKSSGIEYLILGQHLVGYRTPGPCTNSFAQTTNNEKYTTYVNQCIEALNTGHFTYFAHPDVFKYQGDNDFYQAESDRLISAAVKLDIPLELNMLGLSTGRHYPNPLFWKRASALGAKVILGPDAHETLRVYNADENAAAHAFAKKYKLNLCESIKLKTL